ncbi:MAG: hypothetical protein U1F41_06835 [Burkholderiales bacterium]
MPKTTDYVLTAEPIAVPFKTFYTVIYPMSRAKANKHRANGELETFLDGTRRMVLMAKGREFAERRAAAGGAIPPEVSARKRAAGLRGIEKIRERARAEKGERAE